MIQKTEREVSVYSYILNICLKTRVMPCTSDCFGVGGVGAGSSEQVVGLFIILEESLRNALILMVPVTESIKPRGMNTSSASAFMDHKGRKSLQPI